MTQESDNLAKRLQLAIFAECYRGDIPKRAENYMDVINMINQEYKETYAYHPLQLHEENLAHEFPLRNPKS